ncbi:MULTISPECIES: DUF6336 family protein [Streptomyces]|uniref:DUF6336 family protein n=1 Tax=Streptomyces solicathayae TaxID=3081768 RepID=A0ABZ0LKL4_9ACTN|nr:DUF6336 family protein [Streptomyces sp. HUAS YS2]WOX19957.1 DUF6336 family protein [Streptomyces sp. HUAS YS2]
MPHRRRRWHSPCGRRLPRRHHRALVCRTDAVRVPARPTELIRRCAAALGVTAGPALTAAAAINLVRLGVLGLFLFRGPYLLYGLVDAAGFGSWLYGSRCEPRSGRIAR